MRSIIEEIAEAEKQADEIRTGALAKARELVATEAEKAAQDLSRLEEEERAKTRQALADAERDGEAAAAAMKTEMEEKADALCKKAEARVPVAVEYLLNKVQGIA